MISSHVLFVQSLIPNLKQTKVPVHREENLELPEATEWNSLLEWTFLSHVHSLPDPKADFFVFILKD